MKLARDSPRKAHYGMIASTGIAGRGFFYLSGFVGIIERRSMNQKYLLKEYKASLAIQNKS